MLITYSVDGAPVRLTTERWKHICRRHPEMGPQQRRVIETVREPVEVFQGDFGAKLAARFYRRTPLTSKYLVVAYKEIGTADGFILTAYNAYGSADIGDGVVVRYDEKKKEVAGLTVLGMRAKLLDSPKGRRPCASLAIPVV